MVRLRAAGQSRQWPGELIVMEVYDWSILVYPSISPSSGPSNSIMAAQISLQLCLHHQQQHLWTRGLSSEQQDNYKVSFSPTIMNRLNAIDLRSVRQCWSVWCWLKGTIKTVDAWLLFDLFWLEVPEISNIRFITHPPSDMTSQGYNRKYCRIIPQSCYFNPFLCK